MNRREQSPASCEQPHRRSASSQNFGAIPADLVALRRYSVTAEDQAIFARFTDRRAQDRYHVADVGALIKTGAALRAFGSVVRCVTTIETAQRSIERRREARR